MKKSLYILAAAAACLLSCTSKIEKPVLNGFEKNQEPRALTASTMDVVMDGHNEDASVLKLTWGGYDLSVSNSDYQVPKASITPYIEFCKTNLFSQADTSLLATGNEKVFTNKELNMVVSKIGYAKKVKATIYVRVRYEIGENSEPLYSQPLELMVTPYGIIMDRMKVLATDKKREMGTLYSPTENGIYEGYVAASGDWMNFYLQEKDETIWGCVPDNAYNMSNDQDNMWNFWLQSVAGSWRVSADVNTRTWQTRQLLDVKLIGQDNKGRSMKFDRKTNTWSVVVSTSGTESFRAEAKNKAYSIDNKDGVDADDIKLINSVSVPGEGNWNVIIDMSGQQPSASVEKSEEEEQITYPDALLMVDNNDWNAVKTRLYSVKHDGTYWGFYRTVAGWENFLLATEDKSSVWGSLPNSQFSLDSSNSRWNLWGDEKTCLKRYWVSLVDEIWSETAINKISVAGSIEEGNKELTYDPETKTWQADITVTDPNGWGVKILLNDDWGDVFVKKDEGILGYNDGGDIKLPGVGSYKLTVNLSDMEHLTYQFTAK